MKKLSTDPVLKTKFQLRCKITEACYLHSWRTVRWITTKGSLNLHGVLLRILGKESKPNKATSNVPGVLFLNDDMKRTKLHNIANETSKQNVNTVGNISLNFLRISAVIQSLFNQLTRIK